MDSEKGELNQFAIMDIAREAAREAIRASVMWPPMNSAHEAFGVLAEEVDELAEAAGLEPVIIVMSKLWTQVKVNQKRRDIPAMRAEAIQVAAMALRFVFDVCDGGRGNR